MVEKETARAGLDALVAAIAELNESAQDAAVRPLPRSVASRFARIADLRCFGEDLAVLASAMEVLQRRCARPRGRVGKRGRADR